MKVYIKNQQRLIKVNQQRIRSHIGKSLRLLGLHRAELSLLLVNDRKMRALNRQYRGVDNTTDVLSFPQEDSFKFQPRIKFGASLKLKNKKLLLGDLVINLPRVKRQAEEYGRGFYEELKRLMIHGLLHLMGYDHERSKYSRRKMEKKEIKLLEKING